MTKKKRIKKYNQMSVKIIVTGRTFNKEYNPLTGELVFNKTHVPAMLKLGRCGIRYTIKTILVKDSLSMTDDDREKILQECQKSKDNKILITHGTDTMTETAKILGQVITNKTIILTGVMVPYTFRSSDDLFKLGSSLAFLQSLSPEVYISMNGKFFHWDNVRKNKEIGLFEELY
ncbi:Uncharacterised protein [uncultured archaeon]|nr:Uncharacterised protein [uncultured archaeon]